MRKCESALGVFTKEAVKDEVVISQLKPLNFISFI